MMVTAQSIDRLQQARRRETYLDGLLEVAIGCLLFIVALATGRPAFYWTYLVAILVLGPGLRWLKARYTYPRIGYVRFPDEEPSRFGRGVATWVVGVLAVATLALTLTGHLTDNLVWKRIAPALAGLLFSGGFLYLGRRSGLVRHFVLAGVSAALGLLLVWPAIDGAYGNLRVWAVLMALVNLTIGAVVLRRFVLDHPLAGDRMPDEE